MITKVENIELINAAFRCKQKIETSSIATVQKSFFISKLSNVRSTVLVCPYTPANNVAIGQSCHWHLLLTLTTTDDFDRQCAHALKNEVEYNCLSVEGRPHACLFTVVWSQLDPMILISHLDLDIMKYMHTKTWSFKFVGQCTEKFEWKHDKETCIFAPVTFVLRRQQPHTQTSWVYISPCHIRRTTVGEIYPQTEDCKTHWNRLKT